LACEQSLTQPCVTLFNTQPTFEPKAMRIAECPLLAIATPKVCFDAHLSRSRHYAVCDFSTKVNLVYFLRALCGHKPTERCDESGQDSPREKKN
jgi:hypothetical protein